MSTTYFKPLTDEEIEGLGASPADVQPRNDWRDQEPNKFQRPEDEGMKHRVHYGIIGDDGRYNLLTSSTFEQGNQEAYIEFCKRIVSMIAEHHEVDAKDVVLTLVWNL